MQEKEDKEAQMIINQKQAIAEAEMLSKKILVNEKSAKKEEDKDN